MCGIAAFFQPGRQFPDSLLRSAESDIFHRGPDSGGIVNEDGVALIFRRLAIIDPNARADQPMTDPEGQVTLIFNGEIYNFQALRRELEAQGISFRTKGDTEVILNGYLLWGEEVFGRLEGMFGLTLLDRRIGKAIIARDPIGIKPLYLLRKGDLTAVASEVRPLLRLHTPEVDEDALPELLTFGWAAGRLSNYKGIERLPGGTLLRVDLQDGNVQENRFCDPLTNLNPDGSSTPEDACQAVEDSLNAHLISDVGYGLQLSGGVDSSLIAALVAGRSQHQVDSYSIGLDGHPYDETPYQKMVVDRYGTNHHVSHMAPQTYTDALPKAIHHMEGPTPHGGCTMLMLLCQRIVQDTKVVLTGEGADEMFGGYQRYAVWQKSARQEALSKVLPKWLSPSIWPFLGINRLRGLDAVAYSSVYHDFRALQEIFPALIPKEGAREATSRKFKDYRDRMFAVDQSAYLESLLVRQDKMSMAASVEARVPFTHLPLLKVVNRLRHSDRAPGGTTKPILKAMAEKYLPKDLIHRRKIGLWLPYQEWFRDAEGAGRYVDLLRDSNSQLAAYGDRKALNQHLDRSLAGDRSAGLILQRLVELEMWMRTVRAPVRAT